MSPLTSGPSSSQPPEPDNGLHQEGDYDHQAQDDASPILEELAMVTEKVNVFEHFALILLFLLNPITRRCSN